MSQPAKAHEPSMEEILASIRRIIADDDPAKPAAHQPTAATPSPVPPMPPRHQTSSRAAAPASELMMDQQQIDNMLAGLDAKQAEPSQEPEEVLDLTEQMAAPPETEASSFQTIDGQNDVFFADAPLEPLRAVEEPRVAEEPQAVEEPRAAEESSIAEDIQWQSAPPPPPPPSEPEPRLMSTTTSAAVDSAFNALAQTVLIQNARTLEDLVREMLRPMLKSWLDDNLPGMVERIVRHEIERVSRGR
jgi:cell pole-organizing protein PopZ